MQRATNGFGGHPAMRGLGRYYEMDVVLRGEPDGRTGYLRNIKAIDAAVRERAIPHIARACMEGGDSEPAEVLSLATSALGEALGDVLSEVVFRLTPYYEVAMSTERMDRVVIRQSFDFCAAHRLHARGLSDEENRKTFSKCNNPNFHGHNYRVETEVAVATSGGLSNVQIEELVGREIIDRFDHKNLNQDTEEFSSAEGANPSCENMARVFYELLEPAVKGADSNAELRAITVWETDRTSCRYPG